jgi:hypothetical protein
MPNETQLKRLISDAIFQAYNAHGGQAVEDQLYISREDSWSIAEVAFAALSRANALHIDEPRRDQVAVQQRMAEEESPQAAELDDRENNARRKGVFGRVAARLLFAILILAIGFGSYLYSTGGIELAYLTNFVDRVIGREPAQRASLYERSTNPNAPAIEGTASWQVLSEGEGDDQEPVLQVDVKIPERDLSLVISMRRERGRDAAMSHLIELRFLRGDRSPLIDVIRVGGIAMAASERSQSEVVMGQTTNVTPGVFLFGLSGGQGEREENLRILRQLAWMQIPISYRNGTQALLSIEKGPAGERAINEFFGGAAP